jgi:hypothetical protein
MMAPRKLATRMPMNAISTTRMSGPAFCWNFVHAQLSAGPTATFDVGGASWPDGAL